VSDDAGDDKIIDLAERMRARLPSSSPDSLADPLERVLAERIRMTRIDHPSEDRIVAALVFLPPDRFFLMLADELTRQQERTAAIIASTRGRLVQVAARQGAKFVVGGTAFPQIVEDAEGATTLSVVTMREVLQRDAEVAGL
jgi:hypothetical protein